MSLTIESESDPINVGGGTQIPDRERILFLGSELQARARLEGAAGQGRVVALRPDALPPDLDDYRLAVVDLDESGVEGIASLRRAGFRNRIVGFFSHVDEELGRRAIEAGAETYPRGRFWREVGTIIGGVEL